MSDRSMNRDEMERLGALLFGFGWKQQMAETFDINRKTVSRWIADDAAPEWAAQRLRAMVAIAPPPGSTADEDRDMACQNALEPDLSRMVALAEGAGWHRAEVQAAILGLTVSDMRSGAGDLATIETLRDAIAAIEGL